MKRALAAGTVAVASLGAAALAARAWAGAELTRALDARGVRWEGRSEGPGHIRLTGLQAPGVQIAALHADLVRQDVLVTGVIVDLRQIATGGGPPTGGAGAAAAAGAGGALGVRARAEGVELRWGEQPLAAGLAGELLPEVDLAGPGARLRRRGDEVELRLQAPLELGPLRAAAEVELRCAPDCTAEIALHDAIFTHPLLSAEPLPPVEASATLAVEPGGTISGEVQVGALRARIDGEVRVTPLGVHLRFDTEELELSDVVALFGRQIPEAAGAELGGTVGAAGSWAWPEGGWSLKPRAEGLRVEGALPDVDLRGGRFTWLAPAGDGLRAPRIGGDGVPGWVPLGEAGLFPDAAIAAEDAGFYRHPGYDLAAIEAALTRMAGDPGLRGGSTLTQQLAKNLFLDGADRTLARKLRELLLAVELEATLPKRRTLELYINVVELGDGIVGVGEAADAYFLKKPARLSPREAAFLAALLPAPRTLGPRAWRSGRAPDGRIDPILQNMVHTRALSPAVAARARLEPLRFVPPP